MDQLLYVNSFHGEKGNNYIRESLLRKVTLRRLDFILYSITYTDGLSKMDVEREESD